MTTVLGGCVSMAALPAPRRRWHSSPMRATGETGPALAMPAWREVFLEPRLQQVIALALQNNRDLRVAVLQVENARSTASSARALLPSVDASGSVTRSRVSDANSEIGVSQVTESDAVQVGFSSWELDLFGRIRSLKNEALQNWLASAENQRAAHPAWSPKWPRPGWRWRPTSSRWRSPGRRWTVSSRPCSAPRPAMHKAWPRAWTFAGADQCGRRARWLLQTQQDCDALQLLVGAPLDAALLPAHRHWTAPWRWRRCLPTCPRACCCSVRTCCPPNTRCRRPTPISAPRAPRSSRR